ncbi:hypothetical protein H1Q59_02565 [Holosporaceae bacterium 'Namur']|nr:hypothetical protein [Holosporaceae bacterium 'Namur']
MRRKRDSEQQIINENLSPKSTQDKVKKIKTGRHSNIEDLTPEQRIWDQLARLMQDKTEACTAITFVNNKIIITDNDVFYNSKEVNLKIRFIENIMEYFSNFIQNNTSLEERKRLFIDICTKKAQGRFVQPVTLPDDIIQKIAMEVITEENYLNYPLGKVNCTTVMKSGLSPEDTAQALQLFTVFTEIAINLIKIEETLVKFGRTHPINLAFINNEIDLPTPRKDKRKLNLTKYQGLAVSNAFGYALLHIEDKAVHAEMRILSFLLATTSLINMQSIYIGITKLCCHNCRLVLESVNKALDRDFILNRGQHDLEFKNWEPPFFLKDNFKKHCFKDNYSIVKKIRENYNTDLNADAMTPKRCTPKVNQYAISPFRTKTANSSRVKALTGSDTEANPLDTPLPSFFLPSAISEASLSVQKNLFAFEDINYKQELEILSQLLKLDSEVKIKFSDDKKHQYKIVVSQIKFLELSPVLMNIFSEFDSKYADGFFTIIASPGKIICNTLTERLLNITQFSLTKTSNGNDILNRSFSSSSCSESCSFDDIEDMPDLSPITSRRLSKSAEGIYRS